MVKVSIVIPVKNNANLLEKCLASIRNLDFPENEFEVIVVDGGSTDSSVEVAKRFGCRVIVEDRGVISYARDLGVKCASGEFIAFTDSDCIVDKGWIKELLKCFKDDSIAAVGGPNLTPEDDSDFGKSVGDVLSLLSRIVGSRYGLKSEDEIEVYHNPTCNSMYRRRVLEEIGGFNHRLVAADDEELDYRIREKGYKILYTPKAIVYHYRRCNWRNFAKMAYNYGLGRMQVMKLHKNMGRWFHYVPLFFILLILLCMLFAFERISFLLVLLVLSSGGVGIATMSLYLWNKTRRSLLRYFGLIVVWLCGYGIGMLRGLAK